MTERFWARVKKSDGCWEWTGGVDTPGYGMLRIPGPRTSHKKVRASRYSWELHNGPIPEGMCILHKCDNPACVNPDHLWIGTQSENMLDMHSKKRQLMSRKNTCKNGHPLEGENLFSYGPDNRWRGCRKCRSNAASDYEKRQRIKAKEFIG